MHTPIVLVAIAIAASIGSDPAAAEATPIQVQVNRLEQAIDHYRSIEQRAEWRSLGGIGPRFDQAAMAGALRKRLTLTGDLSAAAGGDAQDLAAAVKRFQRRHGLAVDGRVGRNTLAALDVPITTRIAQLELNWRRFKASPDLGPTYITVNVAAATLEVTEHYRVVMEMPVIVGDRHHPTPDFRSHVAGVVFHPPWNVPRSISVHEILPKLRRDPRYLARNDIVILNRPDDPFGTQVNWASVTANSFRFQLQQRPGRWNALGVLKFNVPNEYDVYLHDTPTRALFEKPMRALSHGCVRISKPEELAAWLLAPQGWDRGDIDAILETSRTRQVPIDRIVPVYVSYFTAFVDAEGAVNFRDDIYYRDREALDASPKPHKETNMAVVRSIGCGS